jgi:hypothetical protein
LITRAVLLITITLFVIGSQLVQPTLSKFTLAQQQEPAANQTEPAANQTASVPASRMDPQGMASALIEDATRYIEDGDTQKALSYLTLASKQLSSISGKETASTLIEDATRYIGDGETQKALSYLTVASEQLSTQTASGEFNPQVAQKGQQVAQQQQQPTTSPGEFNTQAELKPGETDGSEDELDNTDSSNNENENEEISAGSE